MKREAAVSTAPRHVLHSLAVGVIVVDLQGIITTINRAPERIATLSAAGAQGISIDQLLSLLCRQTYCFQRPAERPETFVQVVARKEGPHHLSLKLSPLQGEAGEHWGTVLLVDHIAQQTSQVEQRQRAKRLNAVEEWLPASPKRVKSAGKYGAVRNYSPPCSNRS